MGEVMTAGHIARMTDAQLVQAFFESRNVVLPDYLNDMPDTIQKFVYYMGLNSKPLVLDRKHFDRFMQDNNIPKNQIMSRLIRDDERHTAHEYVEMFKYSELNYIGGKYGGRGMGAGAYFEMNGGGTPGIFNVGRRPGIVINAVYNPATVKPIDPITLENAARRLIDYRPVFCRAVGPYNDSNMTIYALSLGCNAIIQYYDGADLYAYNAERRGEMCVIDRGALVLLDEEKEGGNVRAVK